MINNLEVLEGIVLFAKKNRSYNSDRNRQVAHPKAYPAQSFFCHHILQSKHQ